MAYTISKAQFDEVSVIQIRTRDHFEVRPAEHVGIELNFDFTRPLGMKVDQRRLTVLPGQIFVCNGRVPHTELHEGGSEIHNAIVLEESLIGALLGDTRFTNEILFENPILSQNQRSILALSKQVFAFRDMSYVSNDLLSHYLEELAVELLFTSDFVRALPIHFSGYHADLVRRSKRYIIENSDDSDLNIDTLAKAAGLSKFHFIRVFKKEVGTSPLKYLNRMRTEKLMGMLATEQRSITELAYSCGFNSLSRFYALFNESAGTAPRNFLAAFKEKTSRVQEETYSYLLQKLG